MARYYEIMVKIIKKVFKKYEYFQACYILDDEFHFLFHTNDVPEDLCRVSKIVVLPATYTTALVNKYIIKDEIQSVRPINFGELCYDGRLIKLKIKEIGPYFDDLIDHGKLFIGNITVGDGKKFVKLSMAMILKRSRELKVDINDNHSIVFGRLVDKYGTEIRMNTLDVRKYKENVLSNIDRYRPMKKSEKYMK